MCAIICYYDGETEKGRKHKGGRGREGEGGREREGGREGGRGRVREREEE